MTSDQHDFIADMAYLNGLADFMLEVASQRLPSPPCATIFERLKADMSCYARRAVFSGWPQNGMFEPWGTLQGLWEAA